MVAIVRESLVRPLYSFRESDRLAHVKAGTSKRWLSGYDFTDDAGRRVHQPPVTPKSAGKAEYSGLVSFHDLVEVVAIGRLRREGFSLPLIRRVVANCQEILHVPRPLSSLAFKTDGREIFVARDGRLTEVGRKRGSQAWEEVLDPYLKELDYQDNVARAWWPLGKEHCVVVDPEVAFGLPTIARSGVRTEIVFERFNTGDSIAEIADDFSLLPDSVEEALRFETQRTEPAA